MGSGCPREPESGVPVQRYESAARRERQTVLRAETPVGGRELRTLGPGAGG